MSDAEHVSRVICRQRCDMSICAKDTICTGPEAFFVSPKDVADVLAVVTSPAEVSDVEAEIDAILADWPMGKQHNRNLRRIALVAAKYDLTRLRARVADLEAQYAEQHEVVARIWALFGSPSYEELAGRSLYDLITGLQAQVAAMSAEPTMDEAAAFNLELLKWPSDCWWDSLKAALTAFLRARTGVDPT